MIYMIATVHLLPERIPEFSNILEKEFLPLAMKHGSRLTGAFRTSLGDVDEVTDIWEFESLAHLEKVRQSQFQDPEYVKVRKKIRSLMTSEVLKIVSPLPCSPMK